MSKLYETIATTLLAMRNCERTNNAEWLAIHSEKLTSLMHQMPSGSGFDNGTQIDLDRSSATRLVFTTSFHHMNDNGYYVGWTEHDVIVTPNLAFSFTLRVTGRDRNDIKDYIADTFQQCLMTEI